MLTVCFIFWWLFQYFSVMILFILSSCLNILLSYCNIATQRISRVFLAVRMFPAALLRRFEKSTAPCHVLWVIHGILKAYMDNRGGQPTETLYSHEGKTRLLLSLCAGANSVCWTIRKKKKNHRNIECPELESTQRNYLKSIPAASLLRAILQFCNVSCILLSFIEMFSKLKYFSFSLILWFICASLVFFRFFTSFLDFVLWMKAEKTHSYLSNVENPVCRSILYF